MEGGPSGEGRRPAQGEGRGGGQPPPDEGIQGPEFRVPGPGVGVRFRGPRRLPLERGRPPKIQPPVAAPTLRPWISALPAGPRRPPAPLPGADPALRERLLRGPWEGRGGRRRAAQAPVQDCCCSAGGKGGGGGGRGLRGGAGMELAGAVEGERGSRSGGRGGVGSGWSGGESQGGGRRAFGTGVEGGGAAADESQGAGASGCLLLASTLPPTSPCLPSHTLSRSPQPALRFA